MRGTTLVALACLVAGASGKSHMIPNKDKDHHGSFSDWDDFHNRKPFKSVTYFGEKLEAPDEDGCYLWPNPHSDKVYNDENFFDSDTEVDTQPTADIKSEFGQDFDWDKGEVLAFCELSCGAFKSCEAVKAELPSKISNRPAVYWKCCRNVGWKIGSLTAGIVVAVLVAIGAIVICCCCGCCACFR